MVVCSLALLLCLVPPVVAQMHLDAYGGVEGTEPAEVEAHHRQIFYSSEGRSREDFAPSAIVGIRFGRWLESAAWVGIALDVSYCQLSSDRMEVGIFSGTPLVRLRLPLSKSERFPGGRLQPYLGAGFRFVIASCDYRPDPNKQFQGVGTDAGFEAGFGGLFYLSRRLACFGECRFSRLSLTFSGDDISSLTDMDIETELRTQRLTFGVSWIF